MIEKQLAEKRSKYEASGLIARQHQESPALNSRVDSNQEWARRYNPIRLAIEHASLRAEVIDRQGTDPGLPAIAVQNPEACDIDPENLEECDSYTSRVSQQLTLLGMAEMVMLRRLDICELSFGFTRVASTPSTTEKDLEMRVRLRAFTHVEKGKRPIYVLEQNNEGFYIRLNEGRVIEWLVLNGLDEELPPRDAMKLGGGFD